MTKIRENRPTPKPPEPKPIEKPKTEASKAQARQSSQINAQDASPTRPPERALVDAQRASEQLRQTRQERAETFSRTGQRPHLAGSRRADSLLRQSRINQSLGQPASSSATRRSSIPMPDIPGINGQTSPATAQPQEPPAQASPARATPARTTPGQATPTPEQSASGPSASPDVTHAPGTLTQEDVGDANVNCIDHAYHAVQEMDPATRAESDVVFLRDTTNADGNDAGHVMIEQPDGSLLDPTTQETTSWEALEAEGRYEPVTQDGEPYTMSADRFGEMMSAPPGERDLTGVPPEVADMRLADTEVGPAGSPTPPASELPNLEVVDLSEGIDVDQLGETLGNLTNERGENARLEFNIDGAANIQGGPVQIGAWGELGIQVSQSDVGSTVLSFDAEVAATAGLDLGLFEVEVGAGGSYRASASFANSEDAARWIGQQLEGVNEAVGRDIFDLRGADGGDPDLTLSRPPRLSSEVGVLGQASLTIDPANIPGRGATRPRLDGEISVRRDGVSTTFQVPDGEGGYQTAEGFDRATTYSGSFQLGRLRGSYTRTDSEVGGHPIPDNNGVYRNERYSVTLTASDMENTEAMEQAVAGLLGFDGPPPLGDPSRELFDRGMRQMSDDGFREQVGVRGSVTLTYERNYAQEADGDMALQYERLRLNTGVSANFDRDIQGVGELEVSASATHSEVLFERIGTETESYARGVALRSSPEAWQDFATQNQDALGTMIENGAGGEQARELGLPDPATVFAEQGPEAGVQALADVWRAEDTRFRENEGIIHRAADNFENGGGRARLEALESVADDPQQLADTFDELARRGYSDRELRDMIDGTGLGRTFSSAGSDRASAFDQLQAEAAPFRSYGDTAAQDIADSIHHNLVERGRDDYLTHGAIGHILTELAQTGTPEQAQQVIRQLSDMGLTPEQLQQFAGDAVASYGTGHHGHHAESFQTGVQDLLTAAGVLGG